MKRRGNRFLMALSALALLAACEAGVDGADGSNGANGDDGADGLASLVSLEDAAAADCPAGGVVVRTGVDEDRDGTLQDDEVDDTATLCQGDGGEGTEGPEGPRGPAGPASLIRLDPAGQTGECTFGGTSVSTGIDANDDGVLDDDEVENTAVICESPQVIEGGDPLAGDRVFNEETFGNEGFWTDAMQLPQGIVAAGVTPVQALQLGLQVDVGALGEAVADGRLDQATLDTIVAELGTDLTPGNAPVLNDAATTVALINLNAVIGVVVKDTNGDDTLDVAAGDKVGISCALCHTVTDASVFDLPEGGSIGLPLSGRINKYLDVGSILAVANNSRAYYPLLQVAFDSLDGATIGRATNGITQSSTEAEVDAYLDDDANYPVGHFDAVPDGIGNPSAIPPFWRQDLAGPWGADGAFRDLDDFNNLVYTVALDPTTLVSEDGRAFLTAVAGPVGAEIADDYQAILDELNITGYPYVQAATQQDAGSFNGAVGIRVDDQSLDDLSAYVVNLPAPLATAYDLDAAIEGREDFQAFGCVDCHRAEGDEPVAPFVVPLAELWPGYSPMMIAERQDPLNDVQNSPGTYDDRVVVLNASLRGEPRGYAMPLMHALETRESYLHDGSVATLEELLSPTRGEDAPHPFYVPDANRNAVVQFLLSIDTEQALTP